MDTAMIISEPESEQRHNYGIVVNSLYVIKNVKTQITSRFDFLCALFKLVPYTDLTEKN